MIRFSPLLRAASFLLLAISLIAAVPAPPIPADPDLIPEARAVLTYLHSIYGKQTLAGANTLKHADAIRDLCGRSPAIVSFDLSGWNSPPWGESYQGVVRRTLNDVETWWRRGGIVTMQLHGINPLNPDGSAWLVKHGQKIASPPFPFAAALATGTPENAALLRDLRGHADWLEKLAAARIPVLWRPYHEIEGGWFWWTAKDHPEHTAALWRLMFDYFVKERKLHNLIWVYSAAVRAGVGKESTVLVEQRRRFYPGDAYVDLAGIDTYPSEKLGVGPPQTDTYPTAFATMQQVAPGKMLALCECEAIPHPTTMAASGPRWLYCLPWWGPEKQHPPEWIKQTYPHEHMITLDELPRFAPSK